MDDELTATPGKRAADEGVVLENTPRGTPKEAVVAPAEQQRPEGFAAFHRAEIEKWWPMIRAAGIKAE